MRQILIEKNYDSWYLFLFQRVWWWHHRSKWKYGDLSQSMCWSEASHQVVSLVKQSSISQHLHPDPSKTNGQNIFLNCRNLSAIFYNDSCRKKGFELYQGHTYQTFHFLSTCKVDTLWIRKNLKQVFSDVACITDSKNFKKFP